MGWRKKALVVFLRPLDYCQGQAADWPVESSSSREGLDQDQSEGLEHQGHPRGRLDLEARENVDVVVSIVVEEEEEESLAMGHQVHHGLSMGLVKGLNHRWAHWSTTAVAAAEAAAADEAAAAAAAAAAADWSCCESGEKLAQVGSGCARLEVNPHHVRRPLR